MSAVLVVGATGTVGAHVTANVAPNAQVVAASRGGDAPHGIRFDWYDDGSWDAALDGVERMYLIAPAGESSPDTVMSPFLVRALARGVKRAVLQSSSLIGAGDPRLGRVHADLADAFPEWAVLRPSWFMQNFSGTHAQAEGIRRRGLITSATDGGRVPFIDARDIARVAATILLADSAPNRDIVLTGPTALSYDEVAEVISRAAGRAITHEKVTPGRMRELFEADGLPPDYATMLAGLDALIADGAEDRITDEVSAFTGLRPRSLQEFAAEIHW